MIMNLGLVVFTINSKQKREPVENMSLCLVPL